MLLFTINTIGNEKASLLAAIIILIGLTTYTNAVSKFTKIQEISKLTETTTSKSKYKQRNG